MADLRPGELKSGALEGRYEAWRANLRPERADFGAWRGLSSLGGDVWMDVWMDGWTSGNSPLCPTGHRPFGAAAQKETVREIVINLFFSALMKNEAGQEEEEEVTTMIDILKTTINSP